MHNLNKICLKKKNMQLVGFKIFLIKKKKQTNKQILQIFHVPKLGVANFIHIHKPTHYPPYLGEC